MAPEPAWIMVFWSLGTALLAAGAAWGAVRASQKQSRAALDEIQKTIIKLNEKVQQIDKEYVSHPQCHDKQGDCLEHHRAWETTVTAQLADLKSMISVMDEKREQARIEMMKHMQPKDDDKLATVLEKLAEKLT